MIRSRAVVEVGGGDDVAAVAHREDGRLVDQVGQVGAGEAGRAPGHHAQVDVGAELLAPAVHGQDRRPLAPGWAAGS